MSDRVSVTFEAVPPAAPRRPLTLFGQSLEWMLANYATLDVTVAGRSYAMRGDDPVNGQASAMGPLVTIEAGAGGYSVAADHVGGRRFQDHGDTAAREAVVRDTVNEWRASF